MDMGLFRGLVTIALFVLFVAIWVSVWSKSKTPDFEAAARLPLDDGENDVGVKSND